MKLFHFEIYIILFLFKSSILISNNIWENHLNKYIYNSSKKKWCEYACFPVFIYLFIIVFNYDRFLWVTFLWSESFRCQEGPICMFTYILFFSEIFCSLARSLSILWHYKIPIHFMTLQDPYPFYDITRSLSILWHYKIPIHFFENF